MRLNLPDKFNMGLVYDKLFGLIDEPAQIVRIQFTPDVAYLVKERRWHPSQQVECLKDGSMIVTFIAGGMDELVSWVLSWGRGAQVFEPQVLVEAVRPHLARALERYS
ncbi:MAG: WYL domain-containing protein [Nitrospira sp.]